MYFSLWATRYRAWLASQPCPIAAQTPSTVIHHSYILVNRTLHIPWSRCGKVGQMCPLLPSITLFVFLTYGRPPRRWHDAVIDVIRCERTLGLQIISLRGSVFSSIIAAAPCCYSSLCLLQSWVRSCLPLTWLFNRNSCPCSVNGCVYQDNYHSPIWCQWCCDVKVKH